MNRIQLPTSLLTTPVAHRALHDGNVARVENGQAAIEAALTHGYAIELDVQRSVDGKAMVFHDYDLRRLTVAAGPIAQRTASELSKLQYLTGEVGMLTLNEALEIVAGRVPLLIELKDQDGAMGENVGSLEREVAGALEGYKGEYAVMSFNPHTVAHLGALLPHIARGLTTSPYLFENWFQLNQETRDRLREIPDFDRVGASFVSHHSIALDSEPVARLKAQGVPILTWTIRSDAEEEIARSIADNITFEGYLPT